MIPVPVPDTGTHIFGHLAQRLKGVFFYLDMKFLMKIQKPGFCDCVETRLFKYLQITQDLNKAKKKSKQIFVVICN